MKNTYLFCISLLLGAINCGIAFAQGNNPKEIIPDTTKFFDGIWVGTDVLNPISGLINKTYTSYEINLEAGIRNRYYPTIEAGLSKGEITSDVGTIYKSSLSPFVRLGLNYAIIRSKSGFAYVGYRYCYTNFSYDIQNISYTNGYWNETGTKDIRNEKSWAMWNEFLFGIQVNIVKHLYMGWNVRYKSKLNSKENENGQPDYLPGYGNNKKSTYGLHFNIYYKF